MNADWGLLLCLVPVRVCMGVMMYIRTARAKEADSTGGVHRGDAQSARRISRQFSLCA